MAPTDDIEHYLADELALAHRQPGRRRWIIRRGDGEHRQVLRKPWRFQFERAAQANAE